MTTQKQTLKDNLASALALNQQLRSTALAAALFPLIDAFELVGRGHGIRSVAALPTAASEAVPDLVLLSQADGDRPAGLYYRVAAAGDWINAYRMVVKEGVTTLDAGDYFNLLAYETRENDEGLFVSNGVRWIRLTRNRIPGWQGDWAADTRYLAGDFVRFDSHVQVCIVATDGDPIFPNTKFLNLSQGAEGEQNPLGRWVRHNYSFSAGAPAAAAALQYDAPNVVINAASAQDGALIAARARTGAVFRVEKADDPAVFFQGQVSGAAAESLGVYTFPIANPASAGALAAQDTIVWSFEDRLPPTTRLADVALSGNYLDLIGAPPERVVFDRAVGAGTAGRLTVENSRHLFLTESIPHPSRPPTFNANDYAASNYFGVHTEPPFSASAGNPGDWYVTRPGYHPVHIVEIEGRFGQPSTHQWRDVSWEGVLINTYRGDFPTKAAATPYITGNANYYMDSTANVLKVSADYVAGVPGAPTEYNRHDLATAAELADLERRAIHDSAQGINEYLADPHDMAPMRVYQNNGVPGILNVADLDGDYLLVVKNPRAFVNNVAALDEAAERARVDHLEIFIWNQAIGTRVHSQAYSYSDDPFVMPFNVSATEESGAASRVAATGDVVWAASLYVDIGAVGNRLLYTMPINPAFQPPPGGGDGSGNDQTARDAARNAQDTANAAERAAAANKATLDNMPVFANYSLEPPGIGGTTNLVDLIVLKLTTKTVNKTITRILVSIAGTPMADVRQNLNPTPPATDPAAPFNDTHYQQSGGIINLTPRNPQDRNNLIGAIGNRQDDGFIEGQIDYTFSDGTAGIDYFQWLIDSPVLRPEIRSIGARLTLSATGELSADQQTSSGPGGATPDATTSVKGKVEFATQDEIDGEVAIAGGRVLDIPGVYRAIARKVRNASTTIRGIVLIARNEDVDASETDTSRVPDVAKVKRLLARLIAPANAAPTLVKDASDAAVGTSTRYMRADAVLGMETNEEHIVFNAKAGGVKELDLSNATKTLLGALVGSGALLEDSEASPIAPDGDNRDRILWRWWEHALYFNRPIHYTAPTLAKRDFAATDLPNGYTWGGVITINPNAGVNNTVWYNRNPAVRAWQRRVVGGPGAFTTYYTPSFGFLGYFDTEDEAAVAANNYEDEHGDDSSIGLVYVVLDAASVITQLTGRVPDDFEWAPINAELIEAINAIGDLRTRYGTSSTPAGQDRFFFTDENQPGDPIRYVGWAQLVTALAGAIPQLITQTIPFAAAMPFNVARGYSGQTTLTGNTTLTITGGGAGGVAMLIVSQDATGNRTLTLGAGIARFAGVDAPVLKTAARAVDMLLFVNVAGTWNFVGIK